MNSAQLLNILIDLSNRLLLLFQ
ncbi:uncharacterized protein METZ01_LOCUS24424 [marine metagenome]|uniref:Uncharacterized protein n=1 Tax=marine metagenome TaxID=408172 RepID=A0A381PXH6_9ZZZZ